MTTRAADSFQRRLRIATRRLTIAESRSMTPLPTPPDVATRRTDRDWPWLVDLDLRGQIEERLRFERLLTDLSATFVNVAVDMVDAQIERALEGLVDFLGVERSSFGQISDDDKAILVTHSFVAPGYPPLPPMILETDLPWYAEQVRRGVLMRFDRLPDDIPAEAVNELAHAIRTGMKSNLAIPLKVGGVVLGVLSFGSFREFRSWPDELVQRLRTIAEIFANALARKRADQNLHAQEDSLRKTQDELRLLAGRLIQAQEDERRRIAREMHDDWTQRLAVLAIDAAKLETQLRPLVGRPSHKVRMKCAGRLVASLRGRPRPLPPTSSLDPRRPGPRRRACVPSAPASRGAKASRSPITRLRMFPSSLPQGRGPVRLPGRPGSDPERGQACRGRGSPRHAHRVGRRDSS